MLTTLIGTHESAWSATRPGDLLLFPLGLNDTRAWRLIIQVQCKDEQIRVTLMDERMSVRTTVFSTTRDHAWRYRIRFNGKD